MSAVLAGASAQFTFHGAAVTLSCGSATELLQALASFGIAAANDAKAGVASPQSVKAGRAPSQGTTAGQVAAPEKTAAASTPAAETAAAPSQASTAAGEQGNAAAASSAPAASDAPAVSSSEASASPEVSFEQLKKAFLGLSTKANGRALCEGVLKPFGLAKLSEAKPEQYAAVLAEIQKASA